jgi:dihydroorotase
MSKPRKAETQEGFVLRGGLVVDSLSETAEPGDVLVRENRVEAIGPDLKADGQLAEFEVAGRLVCPGLIDMHVHLREPGREDKETIETGTKAAVRGGFTAVACMPNTDPVLDNHGAVAFVVERAGSCGSCRVFPVAAVTIGRQGKSLTEMFDVAEAGAVAVTDDGDPVEDSGVMRRAFEYASMAGLPVISHSEDKGLARNGVMHEGAVSTRLGLIGIPSASEEVMVARDLKLAALTGGRLHVTHVSAAASVAMIREAKSRGVRVTADVTPHHLALNHEAVSNYDTSKKINPPLRTENDRLALIEGLQDGTIDCVATDHAPHTEIEKDVEFDRAPFGAVGLETAVGVVFTYAVHTGHLTAAQALSRMSRAPAAALGLQEGGILAPGGQADISVIDPEKAWKVDTSRFESKSRNSPFSGYKLKGAPVMTVVGGRIAFAERGLEARRKVKTA